MSIIEFAGKEIHGELSSADASAGVVITLYEAGTETAFTLGSGDFIEITELLVVAVAGGDVQVYFGTDGTPAAGSTIARGNVGSNGGFAKSWIRTPRGGVAGDVPRVKAPIGQIDVTLTARVKRA